MPRSRWSSPLGRAWRPEPAATMLALFYWLLLINNQPVLLPPEDEFDEYVANFLPYFFFGEK